MLEYIVPMAMITRVSDGHYLTLQLPGSLSSCPPVS